MKTTRAVFVLIMPLWLIACVTINVYFPAAAAQKAADRFIQDVYGKQGGEKPPAGEPHKSPEQKDQDKSSSATPHTLWAASGAFGGLLDLLVPPAHAAEDIDINTPAIQAIKRSMAARKPALAPYYASGAIGLTANGLITLRDPGVVPLRERNRVRQLVAADNRDRNALYPEIAKANGHPEWEQRIRSIWAQRWIANAPAGWWYQGDHGNWKRK